VADPHPNHPLRPRSDNEFLWEPAVVATVQKRFKTLVAAERRQRISANTTCGRSDPSWRARSGNWLQAGELKYNPGMPGFLLFDGIARSRRPG